MLITLNLTGGVETQTQKWVVKLTTKALAVKLDKLQMDRKAKLNQAVVIGKSMQGLMVKKRQNTGRECS